MNEFEVIRGNETIVDEESKRDTSLEHCDEITLEHVDGASFPSKNAISSNPSNGHIAFAASSILVLSDPRYVEQAFVENPSSREITAVHFSDDGRHVAFGEHGVNPNVSIYNAKHFTFVNRFKVDGKCSINVLQFHPKSVFLAVLASCDNSILIYDFTKGSKLGATRCCVEPLAMAMAGMESLLVVCGHRKIICFCMTNFESHTMERGTWDKRSILLGKHGDYTFLDITIGKENHTHCIYTVTSCGRLCEIHIGHIVLNRISKISDKCFCVEFGLSVLFIGCEEGMVRICNPDDLTVAATIHDQDMFGSDMLLQPMTWVVKRDVLALTVNPKSSVITTLLSDQKRHSWQINFCDDLVECSGVTPANSKNEPCTHKVVTSHDMHCNLAQLFLNRSSKRKGGCSSQKQAFSHCRQINAIKITPDGREIISGNTFGEIEIFDATSGTLKKVIEAHNAAITFIELMYDDEFKLVASGGRDRLIFILNAGKDYQFVQAISDHSSSIASISLVHSDGALTLVSSSIDGTILIRRAARDDTLNFVTIGELPESVGGKTRVYNHSKGYIITGQERGRINLFPAHPYIRLKPTKKLQIGDMVLKTVAIDPTGSFFVAYSSAGQYVFHLETGQQIAILCALPGFGHISFSHDLNYLINSNDSGCKFLWRLPEKMMNIMKTRSANMLNKEKSITDNISMTSYMSYVQVCQGLAHEQSMSTEKDTHVEKDIDLEDGIPETAEVQRVNLKEDIRMPVEGAGDRLTVESDSSATCSMTSRSDTCFTMLTKTESVDTMPISKCRSAPEVDFGGDIQSVYPLPDLTEIPINTCETTFEDISGKEDLIPSLSNPGNGDGETVPTEKYQLSSPPKPARSELSFHSTIQTESDFRIGLERTESKSENHNDSKTDDGKGQVQMYDVIRGIETISSDRSDCGTVTISSSFENEIKADTPTATENVSVADTVVKKETLKNDEVRVVKKILKIDLSATPCDTLEDETKSSCPGAETLENEIEVTSKCSENSSRTSLNAVKRISSLDELVLANRKSLNNILADDNDRPLEKTEVYKVEVKKSHEDSFDRICRCIQLSNSQETYAVKPSVDYDPLDEVKPTTVTTIKTPEPKMDDGGTQPGSEMGEEIKQEVEPPATDDIQRPVSITENKIKMEIDDDDIEYSQHIKKAFIQWVNSRIKDAKDLCVTDVIKEITKSEGHHNSNDKSRPSKTIEHETRCDKAVTSPPNVSTSSASTFCSTIRRSESTSAPQQCLGNQPDSDKVVIRTVEDPKPTSCLDNGFPFTRAFVKRLDTPLSIERHSPSPPKLASSSPSSQSPVPNAKSVVDRIGGVAELFRNQDDYLRKLKEVRRNFERSIQALSEERRSQQMEAHRYMNMADK